MCMGLKIPKKLLCTFHSIQLVLFLPVNHKPISGLMSAEIFFCWISIVNLEICLFWGKRNVFLTQWVSVLDLCQSFICILFNDLHGSRLEVNLLCFFLYLIEINIIMCSLCKELCYYKTSSMSNMCSEQSKICGVIKRVQLFTGLWFTFNKVNSLLWFLAK